MDEKIMYIIISSSLAIIFFNQLANILSKELGWLKGITWAFFITGIVISLCSLLFCLYEYHTEKTKPLGG